MNSFLNFDKELIDSAMDKALVSGSSDFDKIVEAMRYSALGGKRLRGILTLEFAKLFGCDYADSISYAVAVECIQAYSLIHDDLPCMDDDDMRRGKPSCHIAFGEANALLAGDALLTHAFYAISESDFAKKHPERAVNAIRVLSDYAGFRGMVGGQVLDLEAAEKEVDTDTIFTIHRLKTGALIKAAVLMGCYAAGADEENCNLSEKYASEFGFAFQIADDILDFNEDYDTCELNSCVKIYGLEKAKSNFLLHIAEANSVLEKLEQKGFDTEFLKKLLEYLCVRVDRHQND